MTCMPPTYIFWAYYKPASAINKRVFNNEFAWYSTAALSITFSEMSMYLKCYYLFLPN